MCSICSIHRELGLPTEHETTHTEDTVSRNPVTGFLHKPMSRGQLLTAVGGGLGAALTAGLLSWTPGFSAASSLPYVVLIVLDGARWEYFNVPGIPTVRSLIRNGTQYTNAFAGILESETPSGHTSIGTGSTPARTGIPSFWWANSDNVQVSLFSPTKVRAGDMEKIIRQAGVPTLAGRVHSKSSKSKVVALSGSKYYAADAIGGPDADITMYFQGTANGHWAPTYIPGHPAPTSVLNAPGLTYKSTHMPLGVQNQLAMKLAATTFQKVRQQVTLINLPEFDWPLGHVDGGVIDPQGARTLMQGFDRDLAMLQDTYRKAGVLGNTLFVLLSDHGMMPLQHKVSQSDIRGAVAKSGTSIISEAYTSGTYLWLKDETKASAAARSIARLNNKYIQAVYARVRMTKGYTYVRVSSAKLQRAGGVETANQYLLNTFNGSNAPDVVVSFAEGVGCEPGGQANWKGDHGGTSWQAQNIPLILSGPGINSGHTSSYPARLIDIAPTLLQAMGISHQGMQGIPLADAFKSPPSWTKQWQQTTGKQLMPVVTALQQESRLEVAAAV